MALYHSLSSASTGTCAPLTPRLLFLLLLLVAEFPATRGHGRLLDPPSRASMWRLGFDSPADYDDHQGYCGGKSALWNRFDGKCGVCGDPIRPRPRPHERGGQYYTGTPTRVYQSGDSITITMGITANHRGWVEFRVCPYDDPEPGDVELDDNGDFVEVTQDCLDRHLLELEDGQTRYYLPEPYSTGEHSVTVQLPPDLECEQCLFQWKWNVGNSWGTDPDGTSCIGCGEQEQFYACADIVIESPDSSEASSRPEDDRPRHRPQRRRSKGHNGKGHRHRNPGRKGRRHGRRNHRRNKHRGSRRGRENPRHRHQSRARASTVSTSTSPPTATSHREGGDPLQGLDKIFTNRQEPPKEKTGDKIRGESPAGDSDNDISLGTSRFWWLLRHVPLSPHVFEHSDGPNQGTHSTDMLHGKDTSTQDMDNLDTARETGSSVQMTSSDTDNGPGFWNWLKTQHLKNKIPQHEDSLHERKLSEARVNKNHKDNESQAVKTGATWYDRLASKLQSTALGRILSRTVRSVETPDIPKSSEQEGYSKELNKANPKLLARHLNVVNLRNITTFELNYEDLVRPELNLSIPPSHSLQVFNTSSISTNITSNVKQFEKNVTTPFKFSRTLRLNTSPDMGVVEAQNIPKAKKPTEPRRRTVGLAAKHKEKLQPKHEARSNVRLASHLGDSMQDVAHPTSVQRDMEAAWQAFQQSLESHGHEPGQVSDRNEEISHADLEHTDTNKAGEGENERLNNVLEYLRNALQRRINLFAGNKSTSRSHLSRNNYFTTDPKRIHANEGQNSYTKVDNAGDNNTAPSNHAVNTYSDDKYRIKELPQNHSKEVISNLDNANSETSLPASNNFVKDKVITLHHQDTTASNPKSYIRQPKNQTETENKVHHPPHLKVPMVNSVGSNFILDHVAPTPPNPPVLRPPRMITKQNLENPRGEYNGMLGVSILTIPLSSLDKTHVLNNRARKRENLEMESERNPTQALKVLAAETGAVSHQHSVSMARNELPLYDHANLRSSQTYSHGHHPQADHADLQSSQTYSHGHHPHADHADLHSSQTYNYHDEHDHEDYHEEHDHEDYHEEHDHEDYHEEHDHEDYHDEHDHEDYHDEHDHEDYHNEHDHEDYHDDHHEDEEDEDYEHEHDDHDEYDHEDFHEYDDDHEDHEDEYDEHDHENFHEEEDKHDHEDFHGHEDEHEHDYHADEEEHDEDDEGEHDNHHHYDEYDEDEDHDEHNHEEFHEYEDDDDDGEEHEDYEDEHDHEHFHEYEEGDEHGGHDDDNGKDKGDYDEDDEDYHGDHDDDDYHDHGEYDDDDEIHDDEDDEEYHEEHHQHDHVDPDAWVFHHTETHAHGHHAGISLSEDKQNKVKGKAKSSSSTKRSKAELSKMSEYDYDDCDDEYYGVHGEDDEYHGYDSHEYDHECGSYHDDSSYEDDEDDYEDREYDHSEGHHEHHGSNGHEHLTPEFPPFPSLSDDDYKYEYTYEYDAKGGYDYSPYYPEKSFGSNPSISKGASHQTKAKLKDKEPVIICREDSHSTSSSLTLEQPGHLTFSIGKELFYVIPVSAETAAHTDSNLARLTEMPVGVAKDISERLVGKQCKTSLWPLSATSGKTGGSKTSQTSTTGKLVESTLHMSRETALLCRGAGLWAHLEGMSEWCQQNCERGYCPQSHCRCD
ncbi:high mobility group nucleosome-binding domain-containing protein 5 [Elysia marginata]|uniref:High mobility group nucleosome-binding domain-containing protein 5 n=1 Tax=Elysia marginata TaxID=1093978 RepID=A0AAV4JBN3_9GAST|nr:high mobility group nucleosome-binding domain-containing protein 5 [Elysia marginata]